MALTAFAALTFLNYGLWRHRLRSQLKPFVLQRRFRRDSLAGIVAQHCIDQFQAQCPIVPRPRMVHVRRQKLICDSRAIPRILANIANEIVFVLSLGPFALLARDGSILRKSLGGSRVRM